MSNHILTEGQKKRIEENRRKALALRAQKSVPPSGSSNSASKTKTNNDKFPASPRAPGIGSSTNAKLPSQKYNSPAVMHQSQRSIPPGTVHQSSRAEVSKDKFYGLPGQVIRGKCVLKTQERFGVEVCYHGTLIEFFKQMATRSYDTASKIWSFHLKEYDTFMKGARNFQPEIVIDPLPDVIIKAFGSDDAQSQCCNKEFNLSRVDNKLVETLMPFQREGTCFAIQHGGRVLLADGMGLGKTLQALCIAGYYRSEWPLLIVAPSSVRYDWAQQVYKWLPSVDPLEVNVIDSGKASVKEGLVNIISYDLMPKKVQDLKERNFKVIVMDESHFLKNAKAIRTKAAIAISKQAKRVILLTGTPALSRPCELFTQISTVFPNFFKFHDFGLRYCAAKQLPWGWDYSGASNLEELQLLLEKKVMIRRQKSDVLQQLPDKTRQVVILNPVLVSFNKSLSQASKIMDKTSLKGAEKRGALLQYFHETGKAKLKSVRDFILDLVESDKKFLVFAHHKEMLDCIEDAILEHTKVKYIRIDGNTKSQHRSLLCKKFQNDEDYKVAVLSIMAANAGLNLSAANLVVFAELFWNPGILVQAEDRVHRIGQKNAVLIQYLVARKTADDFIWPLVQDKLTVLSQAGLTKDCFSDADTKHVMDKRQSSIMDMFKQSFIDNSLPSTSNGHSDESDGNDAELCDFQDTSVTPVKRKRQRSSSHSPSSKASPAIGPESPRKRQLRITKFLQSPEKNNSGIHQVTCPQNNKTDRESSVTIDDISCEKSDDMPQNKAPENDEQNVLFGLRKSQNSAATDVLSDDDFEALSNSNWEEDF